MDHLRGLVARRKNGVAAANHGDNPKGYEKLLTTESTEFTERKAQKT